MDMDPLEIKTEPPEQFVVFHSFSDDGINGENQEYEDNPLDVEIEQPILDDFVTNDFHHIGENGAISDTQDNGDFSSELTLVSVSFLSYFVLSETF